MNQYNYLNVKLNKLKSAIKNETEVLLRLSSNMVILMMKLISYRNYY